MNFVSLVLVFIGLQLLFPLELWSNDWWGRTILITGAFIALNALSDKIEKNKK